MSNKSKKLSFGGKMTVLATLLTIVAFVVAIISNSFPGYDMHNMNMTAILSVVAIVLGVATIVLSKMLGNKKAIAFLQIAMVVALSFLLWTMVEGKTDVWGTVIFSDLERGFPPADNSAYTGVVAVALYLVAGLVSVVANFSDVIKKK